MHPGTLVTFAIYLVAMLAVGVYFFRRTGTLEDYLLGGRGLNPWIGGVLLAAILAAIMSTIDSQLLVSSSSVTEDLYARLFRKTASQAELVWVGRCAVVVITAVAAFIALDREGAVLGLVRYAWGGLGASFGPVVVFTLFWRRTSMWAPWPAWSPGP